MGYLHALGRDEVLALLFMGTGSLAQMFPGQA